MKPIAKLILLCAASALLLPLPRANGQDTILDKTTLGQSQNDSRDLANSLTAAPPKFGKGEKKEQVNTAELKSKTIKDTTFGGSLMNMGIVGAAPKLDEHKEHAAPSGEAKPSKESHAVSAKESTQLAQPLLPDKEQGAFSNLSDTANLAEALGQSDAQAEEEAKASNSTATSSAGTTQDKQQKSTSATTDEKPSSTSTEKSSTAKPDGNH